MDSGIPQQNKSLGVHSQRAYNGLLQHGFILVSNDEKELSFFKGNVLISIVVDSYAHEIESYLQNTLHNAMIRLCDALSFCMASSTAGLYQFSSVTQIPDGIATILDSILYVVENHADLEDFICKVAQYVQNERKMQAEKLDVDTVLKQGDQMWHTGKTQEAAQIYDKYKNFLSKVQLRRLLYLESKDDRRQENRGTILPGRQEGDSSA